MSVFILDGRAYALSLTGRKGTVGFGGACNGSGPSTFFRLTWAAMTLIVPETRMPWPGVVPISARKQRRRAHVVALHDVDGTAMRPADVTQIAPECRGGNAGRGVFQNPADGKGVAAVEPASRR